MTKSRDMREYRDGCRSFVNFAIRNYITLALTVKFVVPVSRVEITRDTNPASYLRI
jgi:hypothetical protein